MSTRNRRHWWILAAAGQALALAATMNPKPNTSALEKKLAEWKAKK